jgi:hypothetical protein
MDDTSLIKTIKFVLQNQDDFDEIYGKSKEMLRMMKMKLSVGILKKCEICRPIIALEISLKLLNCQFNKTKLLQHTPCSTKDYQNAFVICKNVLNIQFNNAAMIEILSIRFGATLKPIAYKTLEVYKTCYVNKLEKSVSSLIDLNSAVYHAAAFYISSKVNKIKIDKKEVIQMAEVNGQFFKSIHDNIVKNTSNNSKENNQNDSVRLNNNIKLSNINNNNNRNNIINKNINKSFNNNNSNNNNRTENPIIYEDNKLDISNRINTIPSNTTDNLNDMKENIVRKNSNNSYDNNNYSLKTQNPPKKQLHLQIINQEDIKNKKRQSLGLSIVDHDLEERERITELENKELKKKQDREKYELWKAECLNKRRKVS